MVSATNNTNAAVNGFLTELVNAYPDNPALGSPFNTGNNTFGLNPSYKKASAIIGDVSFQAPRRAWMNAAASRGVAAYGYLFTQEPNAVAYTGGVCRCIFITVSLILFSRPWF